MKNKWSGLLVVLVGVAAICLGLSVTGLGMSEKIFLFVVGGILVICGGLMLKKVSEALDKVAEQDEVDVREETRYSAKSTVLSQPEIRLLGMLRHMVEGRYEVMSQVALVSFVDKLNYASYRNDLFRIIDFVICDVNFKPIAAIELNDASHKRKERIERDQKVADILKKAGVALVVVDISELGDYGKIRRRVLSALR